MVPRPGIVKARAPALVRERTVRLARVEDGVLADWLASADVLSEGQSWGADGAWYGTTSVVLPAARALACGLTAARLALVLGQDPHTRLRLVRIAEREARARAPEPLGTVRVSLDVQWGARGLVVTIEVEAPLLVARAAR